VASFNRQAELALMRGGATRALNLFDRALRVQGASAVDRADTHVAEAEAGVTEGGDRVAGIVALATLAAAQAADGRRTEAAATRDRFESIMGSLPTNNFGRRRTSFVRGEVARAGGDTATAIDALTIAVNELTPRGWVTGSEHVGYWYALARAHLDAGQDDDAARWLEQITGAGHERLSDPIAYVRSHYLLAEIYERRGDETRARQLYSRFLDYWGNGDMNRAWVDEARQKTASGAPA